MQQLILHIPHSSTNIPLKKGYIVSVEYLNEEIFKLTDWYTDDLYNTNDEVKLIAKFSRIFCDVERFSYD